MRMQVPPVSAPCSDGISDEGAQTTGSQPRELVTVVKATGRGDAITLV
jgi:hypothetical protein